MTSANQNIRELNLSHKDLTEIPDEVYRLKQLRVLDLSYNNLTVIPEAIFKLAVNGNCECSIFGKK